MALTTVKKQVIIRINSADEDQEELERNTLQLRDELSDLDLDSIALAKAGYAPDGSKAGEEIVSWGTLLVSLASSGGLLSSLTGALQSWASRRANQKISMEIDGDKLDVTGVSSEDQSKLIDSWITRHSNKG